MENEREHIKILSTLSIAASDTRKDTLLSVIFNVLLNSSEPITEKEILDEIKRQYDFTPYKSELSQLLKHQQENGIVSVEKERFCLADSKEKELKSQGVQLKDAEKERFQNFKNFILDELDQEISIKNIKLLWNTFLQYLYNNFFEYGQEALNYFHPLKEGKNETIKKEDFYDSASKTLKNKDLFKVFRTIVENFPDYASQKDIDFLNDLAQKTLSFTSLGINPKQMESSINKDLINWTLYLDTNVLYSILELHSHPENESSQKLVQLINENLNQINITLRYSTLTQKELRAKRNDFDQLDEKLSNSSIRAMLKSNKLDDFSKMFYENILNDRESTLHPSKIIELSNQVLKKDKIDISRNQKRIDHIGEDYINVKVQEYKRFIDRKNDIKEQFCKDKGITFKPKYRSEKQMFHDITLRELIINLRSSLNKKEKDKEPSLNTIKYYAITLDNLLIDFDKNQLKDYSNEERFPVFFKPSFLLNKLVKVLPVKTSDYKKAFIKAISTKGFNKDVQESRDIQKIVNYLKKKGIDSEKLIYDLITQDIFLEKFKKEQNNSNFNQDEFFESELNKKFKEREDTLETLRDNLKSKKQETKQESEKNKKITKDKTRIEEELSIYKKALNKVQKDVKNIQRNKKAPTRQSTLNFEAEEQKEISKKYKKQLLEKIKQEIEISKDKKIKSWQKNSLWNLAWLFLINTMGFLVIFFPSIFNPILKDAKPIGIILKILMPVSIIVFFTIIGFRYWNENNKKAKREQLPIPPDLKNKLEELES